MLHTPLLFYITLEHASRNVQQEQDGFKLNGRHKGLVYVYGVNELVKEIDAIERDTEVLLVAMKESGLEVNTEKTKYMFMSYE